MAAPNHSINFTARDTEFLTHAFQCLKEKPNVCEHREHREQAPLFHSIFTSSPPILLKPTSHPPRTSLPHPLTAFSSFQIDYDLMALNAGFKGSKSARDSFGHLYNKILGGSENNIGEQNEQKKLSGETAEPAPKKKKSAAWKRKAGM
jgi:hypothetical protein